MRAGRGGMRTRTTGLAGQQQARSPRAGGGDQSAWSPGGVPAAWSPVPAAWSPGDLAAVLARRRGNLILIWPASGSRERSQ